MLDRALLTAAILTLRVLISGGSKTAVVPRRRRALRERSLHHVVGRLR